MKTWHDLTEPDAVTVADRLHHFTKVLQDHLTRALPPDCRVEAQRTMFPDLKDPNKQFELKVRRGTQGYTYRLAIASASVFKDLDDALRAEVDIFVARILEHEHIPSVWEHIAD